MTTATLGNFEAVCRTWRQCVAENREWERRLELLPRGYHDAPAKLRAWGVWERGARPLSTIARGVAAKGAVLALSALAAPKPKPTRPLHEDSDVAFSVSISVETPANPGTPVDRSDPTTYRTAVVCAEFLPFDRAAPVSGDEPDIFVEWAGGQDRGDEPAHAGLQWPITVGAAELLQRSPAEGLPWGPMEIPKALLAVYCEAGEYEISSGREHGATDGASVSISVCAMRRGYKHAVTLLDKAPLICNWGQYRTNYERECLYFKPQHLLPQAMGLDDERFKIGPYGIHDFPLQDLCVKASVLPDADGPALAQPGGWLLGLEFCLQEVDACGTPSLPGHAGEESKHTDIAATPADMLRLLSYADWHRQA